jgi:hypothetical protein
MWVTYGWLGDENSSGCERAQDDKPLSFSASAPGCSLRASIYCAINMLYFALTSINPIELGLFNYRL